MVERTPDGRWIVVDGRRWRATDPRLPEERRRSLVAELMSARSAVGWAKRRGDAAAERAARDRVHAAKVALGERGPRWWEDGASGEPRDGGDGGRGDGARGGAGDGRGPGHRAEGADGDGPGARDGSGRDAGAPPSAP